MFSRSLTMLLVCGLALCAGCGKPAAPRFHLNMVAAVANNVDEPRQQQVVNIMQALFGTPDEPMLPPEIEETLDLVSIKRAAGPVASDIHDRKRGLFREHCVHCHGIGGDGMGPTAAFLNPYPRDYRPGVFKFKATDGAAKPTDVDLMHILENGIPGTSMPSFKLVPEADRAALVEYVKYLSIRGETERTLLENVGDLFTEYTVTNVNFEKGAELVKPFEKDIAADTDLEKFLSEKMPGDSPEVTENRSLAKAYIEYQRAEKNPLGFPVVVKDAKSFLVPAYDQETLSEKFTPWVAMWKDAKSQILQVAKSETLTSPDAIARGRTLYFDAASANCVKCHGTSNLGDGQPEVEDKWSEIVRAAKVVAEQDKDNSAKKLAIIDEYSLPKRWNRPRNLLHGIYRGGRRPIDLYYRIVAGINGSGMPAHNTALKTEEDRWAVVAYVLSLPYTKDGALGFDDSPTGPYEVPK